MKLLKLEKSVVFFLFWASPALLFLAYFSLFNPVLFKTEIRPDQVTYQHSFRNISSAKDYCLYASLEYNKFPNEDIFQSKPGANLKNQEYDFSWSIQENEQVILKTSYHKTDPPIELTQENRMRSTHTCSNAPCTYYAYCLNIQPLKKYKIEINLMDGVAHKNQLFYKNLLELSPHYPSLMNTYLYCQLSILWLIALSLFFASRFYKWLKMFIRSKGAH